MILGDLVIAVRVLHVYLVNLGIPASLVPHVKLGDFGTPVRVLRVILDDC